MNAYTNDDYAGLDMGDIKFYYGYEETHCNTHGADSGACEEDGCDEQEWCFVARGKGGKILLKATRSELDPTGEHEYNMTNMLLLGMGRFIKEISKKYEY